ncbi:MAG: hypothetical protein ABIX01_14950 [Chitinophagaceae bacterium]
MKYSVYFSATGRHSHTKGRVLWELSVVFTIILSLLVFAVTIS